MYRVELDAAKCCAYGNCVVAAPDVFELREDQGTVILRETNFASVPPHVYRAVRSCPAYALAVIKEEVVGEDSKTSPPYSA